MKRLVNNRTSLFAAIGVAIGIVAAFLALFGDYVLAIVAICIVAAVAVTLACLKSKAWWACVVLVAFAALGAGSLFISYNARSNAEIVDRQVTLTGRVTDIGMNGERGSTVYLDEITLEDGSKLRGRVQVMLFDTQLVATGNVVTMRGTLSSTYPFKRNVQAWYVSKNVWYSLADWTLIRVDKGKVRLDEKIRAYMYDTCASNMQNNAGTMYALICGDRNAMDSTDEVAYQRTGITHLLAVSGSHVAFVIGLFAFVFKRLKLNPLVECAIMLAPILLYTYVCGWASSMLRAVVMAVFVYVAKAVHGRYDLLTSLGWAATLILLAQPLFLFEAGFQLSFLSVFGICTLYLPLNRFMQRRKLRKVWVTLINAVAVTASCTLATFATSALCFGEVSVVGILVNIVAIPLVEAAFMLGMFGMIPHLGKILLWWGDKLLSIVALCAKWAAQWDFAVVSVVALAISTVVVVVWLFVCGGYVNLRRVGKIVAHASLATVFAATMVLAVVPTQRADQIFVSSYYGDNALVATNDSGQMVVVCTFADGHTAEAITKHAQKQRVTDCTVVVPFCSDAVPYYFQTFAAKTNVNKVLVADFSGNDALVEFCNIKGIAVDRMPKDVAVGSGITAKAVFDGSLRAIVVDVQGLTVASVFGETSAVANFAKVDRGVDVYLLPMAHGEYATRGYATITYSQSNFAHNFGANKYGNFLIKQKQGKVSIAFV